MSGGETREAGTLEPGETGQGWHSDSPGGEWLEAAGVRGETRQLVAERAPSHQHQGRERGTRLGRL